MEPLDIAGVDQFGNSAVAIRMRSKTRPGEQWGIRREFLRRIKLRFDELGIEIPYPHQTIYFGADKHGHAEPLRIKRLDPEPSDSSAEPVAEAPAEVAAPAADKSVSQAPGQAPVQAPAPAQASTSLVPQPAAANQRRFGST